MADPPDSAIDRRDFLKVFGTTAAALPLVGAAHASADPPPGEGQAVRPLALTVNGVARRLDVEPRRTLASVLRGELRLTGTKVACDRASCGACTVLLDERPVFACHLLALQARGRAVTTIEGLSRTGTLHPLQQAFIRRDALQCGFCTPGMLLAVKGVLDVNPRATREEVALGISGNLCRCGAYPHILDAAVEVAGKTGA
jgi:aerobic-type carbon monoxide dehydrogenase small subunit (CoxS/CutS family)